jgi:hypothetical protein
MFAPKAISPGSSPSTKSASARWASSSIASLARLVANSPPWLAFMFAK